MSVITGCIQCARSVCDISTYIIRGLQLVERSPRLQTVCGFESHLRHAALLFSLEKRVALGVVDFLSFVLL